MSDSSSSLSNPAAQAGSLYIVSTPIGNLNDISHRALEVLTSVDLIAAEDTRHSAKLLSHFNITTPMIAYHDHSDEKQQQKILNSLTDGNAIALISDAGTPLISDPGYGLVKRVTDEGLRIIPVPGACALITALSVSGLATDRFVFEGFLPAKASARITTLEALAEETRTVVFYETSHRIIDSLENMARVFGPDRIAVVARELTKTYETINRGKLGDLLEITQEDNNQTKGEFVILVNGFKPIPTELNLDTQAQITMKVLLDELPIKQAAALAAKLTNFKKRDLYQWALENRKN
jgi:16S rRNA (cytidine1402-2'-O)-methyltransferase